MRNREVARGNTTSDAWTAPLGRYSIPTDAKEAAKDTATTKPQFLQLASSRENHPKVIAEKLTANKAIPASFMAKASDDVSCAETRSSAAAIAQAKPARNVNAEGAGRIGRRKIRRAPPNAITAIPAMRILTTAYASRPPKEVEAEAKNRF